MIEITEDQLWQIHVELVHFENVLLAEEASPPEGYAARDWTAAVAHIRKLRESLPLVDRHHEPGVIRVRTGYEPILGVPPTFMGVAL